MSRVAWVASLPPRTAQRGCEQRGEVGEEEAAREDQCMYGGQGASNAHRHVKALSSDGPPPMSHATR